VRESRAQERQTAADTSSTLHPAASIKQGASATTRTVLDAAIERADIVGDCYLLAER
jgi:hypothetical protein